MGRLNFTILIISFFVLGSIVFAIQIDKNYNYSIFQSQYGRSYQGKERQEHKKIFDTNYQEYLRRRELGQDLAINQRMDWNQTNLQAYLTYHPEKISIALTSRPSLSTSGLFLSPPNFDWKNRGRVTPIKNQGLCGSCWAFASTAQYESLLSIATNGIHYDLSQQYSIECENISYGCSGGYSHYANLLLNQTGIPQQSEYPYKGLSDNYFTNAGVPICTSNNKIKLTKKVTGIYFYSYMSIEWLQQYLVDNGPITIGVNASDFSFSFAGSSGNIQCSPTQSINHAILLYGYNQTHWFVKNSWGTDWGNYGYGYISKASDCGLRTYINIIHVDYSQNISDVNITITLTDSGNNGWNGNILCLKQNGVLIGQFGQNFTNGSSFGPVSFIINSKILTQIAVWREGNFTNQVGFVVRFSNGTLIYNKSSRSFFTASTIFRTFCPAGVCQYPTVKLRILMTDSNNNGWSGNVIGFIQNSTVVGSFGSQFRSGSSYGPYQLTIPGDIQTSLIPLQLGSQTQQIGFVIYLPDGAVLYNRTFGSTFSFSTNFKTFCPIGECPSSFVTLSITMSDSGSNGWNGNIVGLRQNGAIFWQFGSNFTSGSSLGPLNVTINGRIKTQVVAVSIGNFTNQVGFEIKFNGTIIYKKLSGFSFSSLTIFTQLCILGGCPPSIVTLLVSMTDNQGDGWNGNVLGFKQNGNFVSKFGEGFTSGSTYGPLFFNINGNLETQLSVFQFPNFYSNSTSLPIGFTVKTRNGTIIYSQNAGFAFNQNTVFSTFCLLGNCPSSQTTLIVTMTDSGNNGWNGYIFGFRQNGTIIGQFGQNFTSGSSYGPVYIKINGSLNTDVVLVQAGMYPNQIGFAIKAVNNSIIYTLVSGSYFTPGTILKKFCPTQNCKEYATVKITLFDSWGDGWNYNVLGFRQNGVNIFCFGSNFTSGRTYGPIYFTLSNQFTEIIVCQLGNWTSQVGLSVQNINGTIIYSRNYTNSSFGGSTIFATFCPLGQCPALPPLKYFVTMTGSCNGWNGNVLGVRQSGIIKYNLTFQSGNQSIPQQIDMEKNSLVQIVVLTLGTKTWEVGYIVRAENGLKVAERIPGNFFYSNYILSSFIANSLGYVSVFEGRSDDKYNKAQNPIVQNNINYEEEADLTEEEIQENRGLVRKYQASLIVNIVLSVLLLIILIAFIVVLGYLRKAKYLQNENKITQKAEQNKSSSCKNLSRSDLGDQKIEI